ncbi:MAG TPA: transposase [Chloroflexia bacterium]|nr:transposase [Chloroflexia bacterium]
MGYRRAQTNVRVQLIHLRLNPAQMAHCAALRQEAARCWNALLQAHLASRDGRWLSEHALQQQFKGQFALHSQTVQALAQKLIANVDTARALRKTDPAARYPYRAKLYQTVVWKQSAIRCTGAGIVLSNGQGNAPLVLALPAQFATTAILKCELTWRADHYELCLTLDTGALNPPLATHAVSAGVDLGEVNIAAVVAEDGTGISISGRYLRSVNRLRLKRHSVLNNCITRCTPGSRRHKKLLQSKARASAAFYRASRDVLHKAARQLVNFARGAGVAHLAVGDVRDVADGTDKGRHHNQRMSLWAHGQFVGYVQDKARQYGIATEYIGEEYSTRTCSVCRHCHTRAPRGRVFTCAGCGAIISRDGNGAANICSRYRYGEYGQVQVQSLTYLRATAVVLRTTARLPTGVGSHGPLGPVV